MASQRSRLAGSSRNGSNSPGILSRVSITVSQSPIVFQGKPTASDAAYVTKRLLRSTGKAAWIASTTFLILIMAMDREQQLNEIDLQQRPVYNHM